MDKEIVKTIYEDIFLKIQHSNIDLFLCGGASTKKNKSNRDELRSRLEKKKNLSIFYPEDMFMELLSRKKYDLFTLEKFLADNSDIIMIVCESPGSFTELGAFTGNSETLEKLVVLIQKKYKNDKSFIMQGPIRYIQARDKKRVIFFNNDLNEMEKLVNQYLSRNYWFYGDKKYARRFGKHKKGINLISGQFNFILLLLYFYNSIEIKEMSEAVEYIYCENGFRQNQEKHHFEILYKAALKRLYKEGMLIQSIEKQSNFYRLTQKGYWAAKDLLKDTIMQKKDMKINQIRLDIISAQYC